MEMAGSFRYDDHAEDPVDDKLGPQQISGSERTYQFAMNAEKSIRKPRAP